MEHWKDISGYEGQYQISDHGRVKSLERKVPTKGNAERTINEKILSKRLDSKGYPCVMLYDNTHCSGGVSHKVHRLVANAFIDNPNKLPQVNHKDLDKTNNNVHNLEWVTQSENIKHAFEYGAIKPMYGKRPEYWRKSIERSATKYFGKPVIQMTMDGTPIAEYKSASEAGRIVFGKTKTHIDSCCRGTRNQCGGYKWSYKHVLCEDCEYWSDDCDLCY